jgi:protein-tyrosine-phosphatase
VHAKAARTRLSATLAEKRPIRVLFLCTGNSARSILAEALLNQLGAGQFKAESAGSHPTGRVHPLALAQLELMRLPIAGLRSKAWDEFAGPDATPFDVIVTVCDDAASETCPVWPGTARRLHWSIADPAAVTGTLAERQTAFQATANALADRIRTLVETVVTAPAGGASRG